MSSVQWVGAVRWFSGPTLCVRQVAQSLADGQTDVFVVRMRARVAQTIHSNLFASQKTHAARVLSASFVILF